MRRPLEFAGLLVLTVALAAIGWLLVITTFMLYDDEGYVLLTQINHLCGLPLYDAVFTQYGPTPYLYLGVLHHLLGFPLTHLTGRALTVIHWILAAACCGMLTWQLARHYWAAVFASIIAFGYLWRMTSEPGHPGGLIATLCAVGAVCGVEGWQRGQRSLAAAALGAVGALLLFTKINVGLLWLCSVGAFALIHNPPWLNGRLLASAGMVVLPFAMMRPLLGEGSMLTFAMLFSISAGLLCWLAGKNPMAQWQARQWWSMGGAVSAVSTVLVGATLAQGTTPHGILEGVLLQPLRFPAYFHFGVPWSPATWIMFVVGFGLPVLLLAQRSPGRILRLQDFLAVARVGVFIWFLTFARTWLTDDGAGRFSAVALQLVPLFFVPLACAEPLVTVPPVRSLVALLALGQVLHAYPVAGTQMCWGTFLLLPLYVAGLVEAADHLAARIRLASIRFLPASVAVLALATAALQLFWLGDTARSRYSSSARLELAGAEALRLPEKIRTELRILTLNAGIHTDVLFSRPGMFSFNLWSGSPTPTLRNVTHWFWLLDRSDQEVIISRLQATPRSAVITCQSLNELNERLKVPSFGPLDGYLAQNYRRLFSLTDYEFWVPRDSTVVPFFMAEVLERAADATMTNARYLLAVNVAADTEIAEILLRDVRDPAHILFRFDADNCRITAQPITSTGRPISNATPLPLPGRLHGLYRLNIFFHDAPTATFGPHRQLVFLTPGGQPAFEALFPQLPDISAQSAAGSPPPEI